jgi:alkylhydroperoxidase family enzyme
MPTYPVQTIASAPEGSKVALEQLKKNFGVLPNLPAVIANSPKLINSLVGLFGQVHSPGLSEAENQIVLLTDAVTNSSAYAVAFHTTLALQQGISSEETTAIRERRLPRDKRFAALSALAKGLIEKRGHVSEQELDSFIAAGYTKEQVLEVIAIVAASTITNYTGTIANPPLEDAFRQHTWQS